MLISVHINQHDDTTYNGFEIDVADSLITKMDEKDTVYVNNPNKIKARQMANVLCKNVANSFPKMHNRNVAIRKDKIWIIGAGDYPSLLLEFGFISSKKDLFYLTDRKAIKKLARGIVATIYKELLPSTNLLKQKVIKV